MPILPGSTLGVLGGGQLGRMIAIAARHLGYRVAVLDPDPHCAARPVVESCLSAEFEDPAGPRELSFGCDVLTLEIEKVSPDGLDAAAERIPVRPGRDVIEMVQDRARQKRWLHAHGFPLGLVGEVNDASELEAMARKLAMPLIVKRTRGGYDGRGQLRLERPEEAGEVWRGLGEAPCVAEAQLDLELELSVAVARRAGGEVAVYPPALNHHTSGILVHSQLPAPLPDTLGEDAQRIAREIAEALSLEGLLTVEFFYTHDGRLLVNELAPRPHNSYHGTLDGCATSQFEQLVRAVCDLPLGSTAMRSPTAMVNILGDVWSDGEPDWVAALEVPGVHLHLYGKHGPRPGRKMGHLTAIGSDPAEALERALTAHARLSPGHR